MNKFIKLLFLSMFVLASIVSTASAAKKYKSGNYKSKTTYKKKVVKKQNKYSSGIRDRRTDTKKEVVKKQNKYSSGTKVVKTNGINKKVIGAGVVGAAAGGTLAASSLSDNSNTTEKKELSEYEKRRMLREQREKSKRTETYNRVNDNPRNYNINGERVVIKKTYHYHTDKPYRGRFESYGLGGYYPTTTMDYRPSMVLTRMLRAGNYYDAYRYYQARKYDYEMREWKREMEYASHNNRDLSNMLLHLDNGNRPMNYSDDRYNERINHLEEITHNDRIEYSSKYGTEIEYEDSDSILKDEIVFKAR